jgi:valyl-tRNA synthetase
VARMIIAGYEYRNEKPFHDVYLTGIVRDAQRRKMSKSLGNSPDPIDLIKKYSADGVRVGMLLCSPAGNDLLFDESLTEQGRNFGNKIWNAFRLVKTWTVDDSIPQPDDSRMAVQWFEAKLNETLIQLEGHYEKYRLSDALMSVYKLFRDEFSSWYLEAIKPAYEKPIDALSYRQTVGFFNKLVAILHPFMPFITEEIWQLLIERKEGESIMVSSMPVAEAFDSELTDQFEQTKLIVTSIRNIRNEKSIPQKDPLELYYINIEGYETRFEAIIRKLALS